MQHFVHSDLTFFILKFTLYYSLVTNMQLLFNSRCNIFAILIIANATFFYTQMQFCYINSTAINEYAFNQSYNMQCYNMQNAIITWNVDCKRATQSLDKVHQWNSCVSLVNT